LKTLVGGLPVSIPWDYVMGALALSVLVGLAAGVVPAMRAARMDPVEALRNE
jgi:putative ABC transport system permease protein